MRIVIDTNIWISAIATEGRINKWLNNICQNKDIIIILKRICKSIGKII